MSLKSKGVRGMDVGVHSADREVDWIKVSYVLAAVKELKQIYFEQRCHECRTPTEKCLPNKPCCTADIGDPDYTGCGGHNVNVTIEEIDEVFK